MSNENRNQLFDYAVYPIYTSYCGDNEIKKVEGNDNHILTEDIINKKLLNDDFFKCEYDGDDSYTLWEYNDNFNPDITAKKCGVFKDNCQIYQILVKPDKLTDKNSYSNEGTVYVEFNDKFKTESEPSVNLFKGSCLNSTAINKIDAKSQLNGYLSKNKAIPSSIEYTNDFNCIQLPLADKYEYEDNDNVIKNSGLLSINQYNDFDYNSENPIVNININSNTKQLSVKYVNVPTQYTQPISNTQSNVYSIVKTKKDGEKITYYRTNNVGVKKPSEENVGALRSVYITEQDLNTYQIPYNSNTIILYENANGSNRISLQCDEGDYLSGYKVKYINSNAYEITPHCVHFDITSSIREITPCPANDNWPETMPNKTVSQACDLGYSGKITRRCSSNSTWLDPVNNCSLISCPTNGDWSSGVPNIYTLSCANGMTGTRTRECKSNGSWDVEQSTCKTSDNKLVCSVDGDWPETKVGETVTKKCSSSEVGSITRDCYEKDGKAIWKNPINNCKVEESNTTTIIIIISIVVVVVLLLIVVIVAKKSNQKKASEQDLALISKLI